jgi:hypothetical protein
LITNPDQRLGQLIYNLCRGDVTGDSFHTMDETLLARLIETCVF